MVNISLDGSQYQYLVNNGIRDRNQINNNNELKNERDMLNKIYLTRKRMLDINLKKNDIKNKRIYMMFVFIIIIVLIMTIIHLKNSK